jgi:hypothetical protein
MMTDNNVRTDHLAVIAVMAERAPFKNLGRTAIMKCIYFLQVLRGVPLRYSFSLYSYGPFDADVLADLAYAETLGIVTTQVVAYPNAYGYEIKPGPSIESAKKAASEFLNHHSEDLDWVMQRFGRRSAADLELDSTIVFIDRELARDAKQSTNSELALRVRKVKPQFTNERILSHISSSKDLLKAVS